MRLLRTALAAIAAAFLFSAAPAQATPAQPSTAAALTQDAHDLTRLIQYYEPRRGYYRGPYRYGYGYRPYYGDRGYGYGRYRGPRVVCRTRYTAFGPHRVCTRRY